MGKYLPIGYRKGRSGAARDGMVNGVGKFLAANPLNGCCTIVVTGGHNPGGVGTCGSVL